MAIRKKIEKKTNAHWEREELQGVGAFFSNQLHFFISLYSYFWRLVSCTRKAALEVIQH